MTSLTTSLPEHSAAWVRDALGRPAPREPHATCDSCALCPGGGAGVRPQGRVSFREDTKCCNYLPALPNYLIGGILAGGSDVGRRTVRSRIDQGRHLSPLGLLPPDSHAGFRGTSQAPCPHLDDGRCGIWAHRHATCATYFCKHERGAVGHQAWLALRALLTGIERGLALWCCVEEGFDGRALGMLTARHGAPGLELAATVDPADLWGQRLDEKEAFFLACHERVQGMQWADVRRHTGPVVAALQRHAVDAFAALDQPLAAVLRPGPYQVVASSPEGVLAETYSALDPIGLPAMLLSVIHLFDGRPVSQAQDDMERDFGVRLEGAFLRSLVDFGVLRETPDDSEPDRA